ncbi:hypothetical protein E3P99_02854 [Wallemia hederae]|uniref:Ribosome biogenesis protein NOP53 n=1 Tax=Wallemia hederae TaxID=1540922 RepID=A0A4T0FIJ8_9BASI|nr:hypothetical protein E3P99_02854 [Wallemia hederae]
MPKASRKGKKEWRKNVDTEAIDEGLNNARDEAVVYGQSLSSKPDESLFAVDVDGDAEMKKRIKRDKAAKPLKSLSVLSQRSAVAAPSLKQKSQTISKADKDRLKLIAKKKVSGPLGANFKSMAGDGIAAQGLTKAAKVAGRYDLWNHTQLQEQQKKDSVDQKEGFEVVDLKNKPIVKTPVHPHYQTGLEPVEKPHAGQSYNPDSKSHEELLKIALDKEQERKRKADKNAAIRRRYAQSRNLGGMDLDVPGSDDEESEEEEEEEEEEGGDNDDDDDEDNDKDDSSQPIDPLVKDRERMNELREAKRRRKAALQLKKDKAERERTAFLKAQKRDIHQASGINKSLVKKLNKQQQKADEKRRLAEEKASGAGGFEGRKIGRHVVPTQEMDVTLGEDLSESLRGVKAEGNLFRDRFMSLQKRALVEPRQPVASKRKYKLKDYETPAFRFWEKR